MHKFKKRISFIGTVVTTLLIVIALPIIISLTRQQQDVRQRAAEGDPSATINASPSTGTFNVGEPFSVSVLINAGETFNAAEAQVAVSSNLVIDSITQTPQASGGCNFTYVDQANTPSTANPSFAGAILNGSSASCTLYTMVLHATSAGSATITISNGSVKSYVSNTEIFLSAQNGTYTINTSTPPTATPTPAANTASLSVVPPTLNVTAGQTFSIDIFEDSGSTPVNVIQTTITYPSNLLTQTGIVYGTAFNISAFETINPGSTAITRGTTTPRTGNNKVATISFQAQTAGVANINLTNSAIIRSTEPNIDILGSITNGVVNISAIAPTATPTSQPTSAPTNTPTPTRTPTPTQPQATPTTGGPTLTPTTVVLEVPAINVPRSKTYRTTIALTGTKNPLVTLVFVNGSSSGVTYPTTSTWTFNASLTLGNNTFTVFGRDASGNQSATSSPITIALHRLGDINGDSLIDLTDLSLFGPDWKKTSNLSQILSDMNEDGTVDLTDFSILAKAYGN